MAGEDATAEVNTTVDASSEPVSKGSGDGMTSFDEVEAAIASDQRSKELEVKSTMDAVEKVKGEKSSKNDKIDEKEQKTETKDESKAKKIADKIKSKDAKEESEEGDDSTADTTEELPPAKTYKVKNGRDDVELRADTLVPVAVDGQEEEVTLDELRRGYSGQKVVTQRFQKLSEDRRTFDADRQEVETFIKDVFTGVKDDPFTSVLKIAEKAGLNPVQYRLELMDALAGHAEKWSQMSDTERQSYRLQLENDQLTRRSENQAKSAENEKALGDLNIRVNQIQEDLGVTRSEFADMYDKVVEHFQENNIQAEITPELVAQYFVDQHNEGVAQKILSAISPDLSEDWEAVNTLVKVSADNPDLNEEDLSEIAKEVWGNRKAEKVSKKIAKGKPDLVDTTRQTDPQKSPMNFDELDQFM